MTAQSRVSRASQIAAATIGNALEWYDFLIFGYLTAIVSRLFFPTVSEYCAILAATATFGVSFFMRPVGGVLLGMYADKRGRKAAMQLVIVLTTIAMAMMAFAPTYAAFGIGAPLIIVLSRLIQGFATGGEFASSTAFLVECAPPNRRGLYGSWQIVGQLLAMIGGCSMGALITATMSPDAINAWGWRIPFMVGLLIAPVGFWIRKHVEDPEPYVQAHRQTKAKIPLGVILQQHRRALLACFALITSGTIATYILNVYMPIFATKNLGLTLNQSFTAQIIGGIIGMCLVPVAGILSDRIGRKPVLISSLVLFLALLYPMFSWVTTHPSLLNLTIMLTVLGIARAGNGGTVSSILAEQFPTAIRSTGMSVSYNMAVMLFGGTAQFVVTWLIHETGSPVVPAFYMMFGTVIGLIGSFFVLEPKALDHFQSGEHAPERQLVGAD
jgi:MHS family proline/betaine transporter-like MFS transporter